MRAPGADPSSTLAATMLEVALAELAEPERLRRGRRYARQGAVVDLAVGSRLVAADVQGSRAAPYHVEVRVLAASPGTPQRLTELVPKSGHLEFSCTCPDWEHPCKHGVAVITQLAERIAYDPSLLSTWRAAESAEVEESASDETPPRAGSDAALRSQLADFLGSVPEEGFELPTLTPLPHVTLSWDEPWSVMLHDALRVLTRGS